MVRCCVPGCDNNSSGKNCSSEGPHSFHAIPAKSSITRGHWIRFISRDDWNPTKNDVVCSDHFVDKDYDANKNGKSVLKKGSVPTLREQLCGSDNKRKRTYGFPSGFSPQKKKVCADSELDLNDSFFSLDLNDSGPVAEKSELELQQRIKELELQLCLSDAKNAEFEAEIKLRDERIEELQRELFIKKEEPFITAQKMSTCKADVFRRMTGVVSNKAFQELCDIFAPVIASSCYMSASNNNVCPDRRKLAVEDRFLLVLMKLRMGLTMEFIGRLFKIHQSTVSRIFSMWMNAMAVVLRRLDFFPSRERVRSDAPLGFLHSGYGDVRIILDCFEVVSDRPSHPGSQSFAFSHYKHHCTRKFLIGITPAGKISFMSGGYLGSISDEAILGCSGLLDLLESGDVIMADKGFRLPPHESHRGITLITPDFLGPQTQLSVEEMHPHKSYSCFQG